MRISLSDEAQADFKAAIDWYISERAFAAADGLADEIERALSLLLEFPDLGAAGWSNTRVFTLQKFPYSLIYRVIDETIRIIAIAHHSRRPGYWVARR